MEQFQHLHNLNIHSSCRTCLENIHDMHHNIFAIPDLKDKFTAVTSLPVEPGDGYPTSLCDQCHSKIDNFYNFQQMCISARKRFQDYINSDKKPNTFELNIDPNNLPSTTTDLMLFKKEAKGEQEDDSLTAGGCLEFVTTEMSDVKNQEDFSAQDEEDESDDDQPIIKYRCNSQLSENEDTTDEVKAAEKIIKMPETTTDLRCKICNKIFKKTDTLTAHMRTHEGLKPFPCLLCDKSYARQSRLKGHVRNIHEGRPEERFPCTEPGCNKTMSSNQSLRKHIKDIHSTIPKQPYICEECGKVLTSLESLKNHSYQHTGAQLPHACPQCPKRFITKERLKEHMNRHAGIKNFICPHCGAKKTTRTELKTHINYHTNEKTYRCQICDMVFNSLGNLHRHKRIVHEGIKDYPCSYCDKSFGKAETRKHHEMTHTGEKPYECDVCQKKFIQLVAMKKHKKIHLKTVAGRRDREYKLGWPGKPVLKLNIFFYKMEQFQHLHNLNIHSSCRTCLENIHDMHHNIFAIPDLKEKFTVCTSLPVEPEDGYPTSLCDQCHSKIDDFYNFQQMCISARKRFQDYINSDKKPNTFELNIDPNNLPSTTTDLMLFKKEAKGEQEEDSLTEGCLEFVTTEMSNVKNQEDSSEQEEEDESDDDQPIVKYRVSDDENSENDNSRLSDNEDILEDVKPANKIIKLPPESNIDLGCKICNKIFKKADTYAAHMRVHQGLKPFPCLLCDKSYARRSRLKGHVKTKHEGSPGERFPCTEPGCDRTMSSKQTLRKHIKDIHSGMGVKPKQPYICEECGKVLTSLATLKNHRFLHTGAQLPHECPQCQKRYITKNKLKEHMNRHAGIRNYICPHCGARKSTRTELKTHINYHTKEKTYPCQFCDMIFNSLGNFSRHKRIVHEGIKDYPCSYCDKSFGKAETRKHHEMTHTGEKPHECNICHKKFIQQVALKKHKKIHFKSVAGHWDKE
ncbi:zinc finger protein 540-like [Episyrphus balteatus]|uniref:zinc finger protein 540-like n=1 Tax=Episyrphus balteatus TaxID=286459 RepID=UPI00248693F5|nr:zinc finger protein 540-like [Episyrphus balteatus]